MLKDMQTIKEKMEKSAPDLAEKYNLDFIIIFGSYARGRERKNSDIDVGFKSRTDLNNFEQRLELIGELCDILGTDFVDAVDLGRVSPLLAHLACREAMVIFERESGIFADFRTESFKKFVETKSLRGINFARTMQYVEKYSVI